MNKKNQNRIEKKIDDFLDSQVAIYFKALYSAKSVPAYNEIWSRISQSVYKRFNLLDIQPTDPSYNQKLQTRKYLTTILEIYAEEEFPWELSNERTYRFVEKYSKLPKQEPEKWKKFELEERLKEDYERKESDERVRRVLKDALGQYC